METLAVRHAADRPACDWSSGMRLAVRHVITFRLAVAGQHTKLREENKLDSVQAEQHTLVGKKRTKFDRQSSTFWLETISMG